MTSPFSEQFTGLYATPELVGRQNILGRFESILKDDSRSPKLIFLSGVGGIGKTRLLKKALEMAKDLRIGRISQNVLDFYHVKLHTTIDFVSALFDALTPPSLDCFQNYQPAYQALNRARLSGNVVKLEGLREDAINKFNQDLRQLSNSNRVVLAVDTLERVVYGLSGWTDDIPLAESWNWLVENLHDWQNVVVVVAGREESRPAIEKIKVNFPNLIEEITVEPFDLDECFEYFYKIGQLASERGDYQLSERLKKLPEEFKIGAHAYSQGRPILLSLLVDYLGFPSESEIPEMLRTTPPQELSLGDYKRFEEILFNRLQQSEIGETLIALGRVPKGADDELLAELLGVSRIDAQRRLKDVQRLSVVKIRPEDQRTFLHDEMYVLLHRHVYDWSYDAADSIVAFESIKRYYQTRRDLCVERLGKLYAPVEEEGRENLDQSRITETYVERQTVLSEMMFYFLRQSFERGFRHYYRYSQEAIYSNDIMMDMHLQAELLNFLVHLSDDEVRRQVHGEFSSQMLASALQLRPILRSWAESKFPQAIEKAELLLNQVKSLWKTTSPSVLIALYIWTAYAHVMRSKGDDHVKAEEYLEKAFSLFPEEITQALRSPEEIALESEGKYSSTEVWYNFALLSLAYRVYGYLFRVRGYPQQAIENYRCAIQRLNLLDIRVEKATALNDIGFALATQGKWQDGRSLTRDALMLRRELGHRLPVAFSLNALAMIDIYEGQYDSAQNNAERALAIFRARYDDRGKGLALIALSESRRRYAVTNPVLDAESRVELVRQARDHANEAKDIFSQNIEEPPRRIEALIELGCACRDWVHLRGEYPNPKDNKDRLVAEAEEALSQAYDIAKKENISYRAIDALVNLAWLRYYILEQEGEKNVDAESKLVQAIQIAHQTISPEYFLGTDVFKPANIQIEIWPQLGKLYLLEGQLEYYRFNLIPKEEKKKFAATGQGEQVKVTLENLAEKYAKSLQYSALYEKDYRGIRGAKDRIYEKLKGLNVSERYVISQKVRDLYPDGNSVIENLLRDRVLWLD